ncbi:hypothetical protein BDV12DRAFT_158806 [Aspergillus spectabilis]
MIHHTSQSPALNSKPRCPLQQTRSCMAFPQHHHHPPPTRPTWPIAIRPESTLTADPETIITIRNRPEPWHPLDYLVEHERGPTVFRVQGHPWGLAQRRVFHDASGSPLFELRSRWYDSSVLELRVPGAGTVRDDEILLEAKCRVSVKAPRAVLRFRNACLPVNHNHINANARQMQMQQRRQLHSHSHRIPRSCSSRSTPFDRETETVMEIHALDVDNLLQVAVVGGRSVAYIDRVTDPGVLAQGQKPPFRFRPMWRVRVASGVDLALVAVAVVILGQQVSGVAFAER